MPNVVGISQPPNQMDAHIAMVLAALLKRGESVLER
jgi:hypothetical protein